MLISAQRSPVGVIMKIKLWAATDRLGCNIKPEAHPAIQSRRLTAVVLAAGVAVALNANIDINFSGVRIATATFAASALGSWLSA
jgi:hypothetical protein